MTEILTGRVDFYFCPVISVLPLIKDGRLQQFVDERYAGWKSEFGKQALGELDLEQLADHALQANSDVRPRSGRQEYLENLVNRFAC